MPRRTGVGRHAQASTTNTTALSTDSDNMQRISSKRLVNGVNGITVDQATERVHLAVQALLMDEFPDLAKRKGFMLKGETVQYLRLTWTTLGSYYKCLWKTWIGVCFCCGKTCIGRMSPIDLFNTMLFSFCVSVIITAGLIICIVAKIPFLGKAFDAYANRHGGVSFINIVNSGMFEHFREEELRSAKSALSKVEISEDKTMNIDIAKIMLLFSALVYERSTTAKREGIRQCSTLNWSPPEGDPFAHLSPNNQRPFYARQAPTVSSQSQDDDSAASPASPVVLSPQAMSPNSSPIRTREETDPLLPASSLPSTSYVQGQTTGRNRGGTFPPEFNNWRDQYASKISAAQASGVIYDAMQRWGLEYEAVSELDSASSAYSAAFWDKNSNWVVIAFKGTSPPEFDEWLIDFDYTRVPIGHYIPSYGSVHHGFKNRLFPDEPTLNRTPYETIAAALKVITDDLLSRTTARVVNVYFTGHSLGSGIATLAHCRAMQRMDGLDERVRICDAYLFSSPVVSDMATSKLCAEQLLSDTKHPRSIWRVTNRHDAIATLFPALGDKPGYRYSQSLFAFAHLGTEVKMKRKPTQNIVKNNYIPRSLNMKAFAQSNLPDSMIGKVPKATEIPLWMRGAQYIPLAGWMFSHFPGLYFEAIQAMGDGEMEWKHKNALD